jgi:hypothetical protein
MKELLLLVAVAICVVLIVFTLRDLDKINSISKSKKNIIRYVTIFFPVIGFLWVKYLKD